MICSIVQMVYVKSSTSFIISSFSSEKMAMVANSLYRLYKLALELKYCMYNEVSNSGCESFPMSLYDYIIYIVLKSNIMFTGVHLRNIIVITHNCGHAWRGRYWTLCFAAAFHFDSVLCLIFCHSTDVVYQGCWYIQTPLRKESDLKEWTPPNNFDYF